MFSKVAAQALDGLDGQASPGLLQAMVTLFANCQLPLSHSAPIDVTASPQNNQRLFVDDLFTDENTTIENPYYSTLNVSNPFSIFVDGDNPYIDYGTTTWNQGVTWMTWAVSNFAYFNNVKTKKLKIDKLEKDGYQFEDVQVLKDVNVTFSFDPDTCEGTVTVDKEFIHIKTLVQDGDATPPTEDEPSDDSDDSDSGSSIPNNDPHNSNDAATPANPAGGTSDGSSPTNPSSNFPGANDQYPWSTDVMPGYPPLGDNYIPPPNEEP